MSLKDHRGAVYAFRTFLAIPNQRLIEETERTQAQQRELVEPQERIARLPLVTR